VFTYLGVVAHQRLLLALLLDFVLGLHAHDQIESAFLLVLGARVGIELQVKGGVLVGHDLLLDEVDDDGLALGRVVRAHALAGGGKADQIVHWHALGLHAGLDNWGLGGLGLLGLGQLDVHQVLRPVHKLRKVLVFQQRVRASLQPVGVGHCLGVFSWGALHRVFEARTHGFEEFQPFAQLVGLGVLLLLTVDIHFVEIHVGVEALHFKQPFD